MKIKIEKKTRNEIKNFKFLNLSWIHLTLDLKTRDGTFGTEDLALE